MYNRQYTPEMISELKENEIFVFGSNLGGFHAGGAPVQLTCALGPFGARVWAFKDEVMPSRRCMAEWTSFNPM